MASESTGFSSPLSQSESTNSSRGSDSISPTRRRSYTLADPAVKSTSCYTNRRYRNNAAVQRFRNRSKNKAQDIEEEIARYNYLTKLFKQEQTRMEAVRQAMETLIRLHVRGEDVTADTYSLINSEVIARNAFRDSISDKLSDDESLVTN
ncbi:unnamed protein product [Dicrocoelium dendriticum]|nr:unnamed protein product [Dicrocoelium dendriticum]